MIDEYFDRKDPDSQAYEDYYDRELGKAVRGAKRARNPEDQDYRDSADTKLGKAIRNRDIESVKKNLGR